MNKLLAPSSKGLVQWIALRPDRKEDALATEPSDHVGGSFNPQLALRLAR